MKPDSPNEPLIPKILELYDIKSSVISAVQSGYRNHSYRIDPRDGPSVNIIIFKAEVDSVQRINRADLVSKTLAQYSLPVRIRKDNRLIKLQPQNQALPAYAGLYNYLPGTTINWESYTQDHLKLLGKVMAQMHHVLAKHTSLSQAVKSETTIYEELSSLLRRIEKYFLSTDVFHAAKIKLHLSLNVDFPRLKRAVIAGQQLPTQQVLHMDFVRSNILFSEQPTTLSISLHNIHLSGIIDFEKTTYGSPLFDLARTLAFLLVDCKYKSAEKVRKYFFSGYVKHGGGTIRSTTLLNEYVALFLLHDFYKFLRHNPYESLGQNEHYVRTRDILQSYGMVNYT